MRRLSLALAVTSSLLAGVPTAHAGLILNGSFEEPALNSSTSWWVFQDIPGWISVSGAGIEIQRQAAIGVVPQDGRQFVELDSDPRNGGLPNVPTNSAMAQEFWLTPGTYELSFWYCPRTDVHGDNGIDVYFTDRFNDDDPYDYFQGLVTSIDAMTSKQDFWKQHVYTLNVTTADLHALTFRATGIADMRGGLIDHVSLRRVPEPSLLALFGLGLIGVARLRRR